MRLNVATYVAGSFLALALVGGVAQASAPTVPGHQFGGGSEQEEQALVGSKLLSKLHHVNKLEIDLAALAQQRTRTAAVLDYARLMQASHRQTDRELLKLARTENLQISEYVPSNAAERQEAQFIKDNVAKLKRLNGKAFDKAFAKFAILAHEKVKAELEAVEPRLNNDQVHAFIAKVILTVTDHGAKAQELLDHIEQELTSQPGLGQGE